MHLSEPEEESQRERLSGESLQDANLVTDSRSRIVVYRHDRLSIMRMNAVILVPEYHHIMMRATAMMTIITTMMIPPQRYALFDFPDFAALGAEGAFA